MLGLDYPIGNVPSFGNHETEPVLHVIDFEDVALSKVGIQMIHLGAQALLRQYMPEVEASHLTPDQLVHMFIDNVYWEENTGGLIMCTTVAQASLCLPIPKHHWQVRTEGITFQ